MNTHSSDRLIRLAAAVHPYAMEVRRHLHMHPELSFEERETSLYLASHLDSLGLAYESGIGGNGIKVVLEGSRPGPTLALRADMDALPIHEETGLPFSSKTPGVMHACGHDVHTAILLATARALSGLDFPGRVVLIFQPGEEQNPGGASLMIRDGVLDNPKVDAIFGIHIAPGQTVGTMSFGAGPRLAAPDSFDVTICGKGGHGAHPELTVDPVLVACQCITLLQQIVARNVDPFKSAVVTVGSIHGGVARNVIPDAVTFKGTVRTMDSDLQRLMRMRVEAVVRGACEAGGATYDLRYDAGYPVLVNEPAATEVGRQSALAFLSPDKVSDMVPSMGGEDFAFYLQKVPGTFARIGSTAPGIQNAPGLHTSRLVVDESCLTVGVAYYLSVVKEYLGQTTER